MLNAIIRRSLYNRLIVLILSGILVVLGCIMLLRTEVDIFPDLNSPTVTVMTEAPGLSTEDVEQLVTYPIETAVSGSQGVAKVRSSSTGGFSVVEIVFDDNVEIMTARQIVAERLQTVESQLPPQADAPVMGPTSSILGEMMIIGLTSDSIDVDRIRSIADRILAPALRSVEGVSQVSVLGGGERQYHINLNPLKMQQMGVTLQEVTEAVEGVNQNSAAGVINSYANEFVVKGEVSTDDLDEIASSVVKADETSLVTVGDIAEVLPGVAQPLMGSAGYCGRRAVLLTVTKQPGVGTIELTERLHATLDSFRHSLPSSLEISTDIFNQSDFISTSISNLRSALFEGAIMVIVVLFFFMMNLRATIVSLFALPMSIIISVLLLRLLGLNINTMTLGGIAIAIGSLVDDAIVDVENVYKRLRQNAALPEADRRSIIHVIYEASKEVRLPIFNSSLIIVAGFLPLFFLTGIEGKMMAPLGIAFIVALAASTVVALTLTPVLCSYMLGDKAGHRLSKEPRLSVAIKNGYRRLLSASLRHKRAILAGTCVLFIGAIVWLFNLGSGFLPPFNEGSFTINISAMPGITLEESDQIGRMAEEAIMKTPEVKVVARKTGRAELDEHSLGTSVSEIEAPYELKQRSRAEVAEEIRRNLSEIPGVVIEVGQPISHRIDAMMSGTEAAVAVTVFGDDLDTLLRLANQVKQEASEVDGMVDIAVEQIVDRPELVIKPRRNVMARYGITPADFNRFISTALGGSTVSQVYEEGYPRDLVVRFDDRFKTDISLLADLNFDSPRGPVTLGEIASISSTSGPNKINREDGRRRIVVSANVEGSDLGSAVNRLTSLVSDIQLPEGYNINIGGRWESASKSSRTLLLASLLAIVVIFILLYTEFKNLVQSLIIMVNMPLAMIGGVIAIGLTGGELDLPAIIGFIALIGIATRNGMLLISRYNALRHDGEDLTKAITDGSSDRLMPIIMT
ncbi:MAG: efflux RND transporter permease subunit, partial [Muribaculaceae bacterium]|nr:efflux RND transporter permease subunit [Muribaculaceae bacterium]